MSSWPASTINFALGKGGLCVARPEAPAFSRCELEPEGDPCQLEEPSVRVSWYSTLLPYLWRRIMQLFLLSYLHLNSWHFWKKKKSLRRSKVLRKEDNQGGETQNFKTVLRCCSENLKTARDASIKARLGRKCYRQKIRNFQMDIYTEDILLKSNLEILFFAYQSFSIWFWSFLPCLPWRNFLF